MRALTSAVPLLVADFPARPEPVDARRASLLICDNMPAMWRADSATAVSDHSPYVITLVRGGPAPLPAADPGVADASAVHV